MANGAGSRGVNGGHPRACWTVGIRHGGSQSTAAQTEGGGGCGGGGGDGRVIADGAVAPGSPDADVIVLVCQVILGGGHGRGTGVKVEAGDGS